MRVGSGLYPFCMCLVFEATAGKVYSLMRTVMGFLKGFFEKKVDYQGLANELQTTHSVHVQAEVHRQLTKAVLRTWPVACRDHSFARSLLGMAVKDWVEAQQVSCRACCPACLFGRLLDRRIQESLFLGSPSVQQATENFLAEWYAPLMFTKEARHRLKSEEGRQDAFAIAFVKFLARLRLSNHIGVRPARLGTFFEHIFLAECTSELRSQVSQKRQLLRMDAGKDADGNYTDELLASWAMMPSEELVFDVLMQLREREPDCYDLVELQNSGYSYKEIEEILPKFAGKSPDQLKRKAYHCKEKLQSVMNLM